jgi:hypothetical protein
MINHRSGLSAMARSCDTCLDRLGIGTHQWSISKAIVWSHAPQNVVGFGRPDDADG